MGLSVPRQIANIGVTTFVPFDKAREHFDISVEGDLVGSLDFFAKRYNCFVFGGWMGHLASHRIPQRILAVRNGEILNASMTVYPRADLEPIGLARSGFRIFIPSLQLTDPAELKLYGLFNTGIAYELPCGPIIARSEPKLSTRRSLPTTKRGSRLVGFWDLQYCPLALGDILTWQILVKVRAIETGSEEIHLRIISDEVASTAETRQVAQRRGLARIFPAFLCLPGTRSVEICFDRQEAEAELVQTIGEGGAIYPRALDYLNDRIEDNGNDLLDEHHGFPLSHRRIDLFYFQFGRIPHLDVPAGYKAWASSFIRRNFAERLVVCVHMRAGRRIGHVAELHRDAAMKSWLTLIRQTAIKYPDVVFIRLGGYLEWERALACEPNVFIPRIHGLTLGHELALLLSCDCFMGSSSGFSAAVTFSAVPYAIFNFERKFWRYSGVTEGETAYPFAAAGQTIHHGEESTADLMAAFQSLRGHIAGRAATRRQTSSPSADRRVHDNG